MPDRIVVWTLAALAVVLIIVPFLGMVGMMSVGWMGGGMMMGMGLAGAFWLVMTIVVIAALVVLAFREPHRT